MFSCLTTHHREFTYNACIILAHKIVKTYIFEVNPDFFFFIITFDECISSYTWTNNLSSPWLLIWSMGVRMLLALGIIDHIRLPTAWLQYKMLLQKKKPSNNIHTSRPDSQSHYFQLFTTNSIKPPTRTTRLTHGTVLYVCNPPHLIQVDVCVTSLIITIPTKIPLVLIDTHVSETFKCVCMCVCWGLHQWKCNPGV